MWSNIGLRGYSNCGLLEHALVHVPKVISCVVQPLQFKYISIPGIILIYFSIVFNGIVIFIWKSFKSFLSTRDSDSQM